LKYARAFATDWKLCETCSKSFYFHVCTQLLDWGWIIYLTLTSSRALLFLFYYSKVLHLCRLLPMLEIIILCKSKKIFKLFELQLQLILMERSLLIRFDLISWNTPEHIPLIENFARLAANCSTFTSALKY
jgi:hypothetical protein